MGDDNHRRKAPSGRDQDRGNAPATPVVVGIGVSAGGLSALEAFFAQVPERSGLAFVVIVHLLPESESHLAELLQPHTRIPVRQVTEVVPLEADQVYVIPPGSNLDTIDTHLRLSRLEKRREKRAPIDHFFRTLAASHGENAIGVILTGTGSDGTLGLKEIKEKGGLTIAQDPHEAEYDGMPRSAIATGLIDLVRPVAQIPDEILRYVRTRPRIPVPADDAELKGSESHLLQAVFTQIRAHTGRDFRGYKRSTILRRLQRRMQLHHMEELGRYIELLRGQPSEVHALADEFLITVTNFFRDPEVYAELEQRVIPQLIEGKGSGDQIRAWSVGCATGEEAYSLAILLLEAAARLKNPPRIQIFASDLHERSLKMAREGFYAGEIEADVSPERLRRFFNKESAGYRICKAVRELVIFAPHDLLSDPPFSRLDLLACRNLLIYLQRDVQRHVVDLFHYALNPDGFLVLGTSETIDRSDLFRPEHKKHCLFRKQNVAAREPHLPVFSFTHPRRFDAAERPESAQAPASYGDLHRRMMEHYAPPSVLVNRDHGVVYLSEHVGRYLRHPGGEPTASVFKLLPKELGVELRAALFTAEKERRATRTRPIPMRIEGKPCRVALHVRPAEERRFLGFLLVVFEELEEEPTLPERRPEVASDAVAHDLETELEQTRQRLQAVVEEYETSQEEMKAANEELQSTNEELRSTMEELETSKEELQSTNEELTTLNQENRHKVDELSRLSSDLQNLFTATDIATLFLDRHLRIQRFTPRVRTLFNMRGTDQGRPLSDLTHRLGYQGLPADAQGVLEKLAPVEREVQDWEGRWYLMRVLPYRSVDERIEGVVITFVEITARKQDEQALRESEERYRMLVESATEYAILMLDSEGRITTWNAGAERVFGFTEEEALGRAGAIIFTEEDRASGVPEAELETAARKGWASDERWQARKDGSQFWASGVTQALRYPDERLRGFIKVLRDNTERKEAEEALRRMNETLEARVAERTQQVREQEERFRKLVKASAAIVWTGDAQGRVIANSPSWQSFTGQSYRGSESDRWADAIHPNDRAVALEDWRRSVETETLIDTEFRLWRARSKKWCWMNARGVPLRDESGAVRGWIGMMFDIDARKQAEGRIREMASRLMVAEQKERQRLSRILHDDLQQLLYGAAMKISVIERDLQGIGQSTLAGALEEVRAWVKQGVEMTRRLTMDLNPPVLKMQNMLDAIRWLQGQMAELHGLKVVIEPEQTCNIPDENLRVLLFWIVRELLFNVTKHAGVDEAVVRCESSNEDVVMQVIDQGGGFDMAAPKAGGRQETSFGLFSARERLRLIGGRIEINASPGKGTHITVRAPLRAQWNEFSGENASALEMGRHEKL